MANPHIFKDQMNRLVSVSSPVLRIVSLVPSQTELLVDLGLRDSLVGVTKFCIHPKGLTKEVTLIGGTKNVKIQKVLDLKPDVVIGNKEENFEADIEELEKHVPVWMSDISDLEGALEMIRLIGEFTETELRAQTIIKTIESNFKELEARISKTRKTCLYLIWRKPYMSAGKGTFIDDCLKRIGLVNVMEVERYPEVNGLPSNPDHIFLSSEPYPFKDKHIEELQALYPSSKITLVDGEYFSWYGSRLIGAPDYFRELMLEIAD